MSSLHIAPRFDDEARRAALYDGAVLAFPPRPETEALCAHAREMILKAVAPHDPLRLHEALPVEKTVEILSQLKPEFIHHPRSKTLIKETMRAFGCDSDETYFDVPRLRSAFPKDYLAAGIAYAFHPHRDTWYSAPFCQLNWWLPVWDFLPDNGLAFHPQYWRRPLKNGSAGYNYYRWNAESRGAAASQIKQDTRVQPKPEEPVETDPDMRPIVPAGGLILFSGAQLHSTVENTANLVRWSIDFRTVNAADVRGKRGAPNIDSRCTGTTMRDYLRVSDLSRLPEEVVALYDDGVPEGGIAVWPDKAA
jgi:hypothetical protein